MEQTICRAWSKETDDWVYGYYVPLTDPSKKKTSHRIYTGHAEAESECMVKGEVQYSFYPDFYEIDPESLGRYIGVKDKDDKPIFEGDVLHFQNENREWKATVIFLNGSFVVRYLEDNMSALLTEEFGEAWKDFADERDASGSYDHIDSFYKEYRVIGNIYENPELLKSTK